MGLGGDHVDWMVHGTSARLILADVAGKGAAAALLLGTLRTAVREHMIEWLGQEMPDALTRATPAAVTPT